MSTAVPVAFAQKFIDDFYILAQQRPSKFMGKVRTDFGVGAKHIHFDRVSATSMVKKTTRHGDTPLVNTPHSRRRVSPDTWEWGDMIDKHDIRRMMSSPQNAYVQAATFARNRQIDDIIIAAINGNAVSVDEDDAATNVALPPAQKVAINFGGSNVGLTKAKIQEAARILAAADIDLDQEELYAFIGAKQWYTDLLGITEVVSSDFATKKALEDGRPTKFLGFTWVLSNRLATTATPSRLCQFICKSGVGFWEAAMPTPEVDKRPDKSNNIQIYLEVDAGAVRIDDQKVVQVDCLE